MKRKIKRIFPVIWTIIFWICGAYYVDKFACGWLVVLFFFVASWPSVVYLFKHCVATERKVK